MALRDLFTRKPKVDDQPIGDSGRAHVSGFLQLEEINAALQGQQGLAIYDQMYRTDPDVRRAVRMAANTVISANWSVEPFGGDEASASDQEVADNLEWALGLGAQGATSPLRPRWPGHLAQVVPGTIRWGFCPNEITWTTATRKGKTLITPSRLGMRLPRTIYRWLLDEYHELQAIEQFLPLRGYVVIPRQDLLYYRIDAEGDNYEGVSMLRACYKPWYIKDNVERLDAIACEREAVGLPTVYPPRAGVTSPAVLADLETKLQALRAGELAYMIMPGPKASTVKDQGGWEFEILGLAGTKGGRDVSKTLEYHKDAIAAAFVEEFMRLGQSGVGARATADVQEGPFNMACEALGRIFEDEVNELLIPRWVALNYGPDTPLPTVSMSLAEEPLEDLRDFVSVLVASGVIQPDGPLEDFVRQRADLPPADPAVREQVQAQKEAQRKAAIDVANDPASHVAGMNSATGQPDSRNEQPRLTPASGASRGSEDAAVLLDTPGRQDRATGTGEFPTTSGRAAVDGVPTPDLLKDFIPTDSWVCPCGDDSCKCSDPTRCSFVPTVDWSRNIDENPKRRRRNAGDGTDANAPDAVDPPGGRTLARAEMRSYRPGKYGKGLIQAENDPEAMIWRVKGGWNGEPHHAKVSDVLQVVRPNIAFHIGQDGRFYFHSEDKGFVHPEDPKKLASHVERQYPDLKWGKVSAEDYERANGLRSG